MAKKATIKSSYLLIEGWSNKWNNFSLKNINLIIDAIYLNELKIGIRSNLITKINNKKVVINNPKTGKKNEQSYFDKELIIPLGKN